MFDHLNAVLQLDEKEFTRSLGKAESRMEGFGDRAESVGRRAQRAGAVMTAGLTAPLAAMGFMSVRAAGNFEQQMANSIAVMGDVSDAMREELEATAREVARTTTFSAAQAAEAFYFLSSAGLDAEQSMAALPQVANFAAAGNMDLAEATDVATNVMSAYNVEAENMSEVTDILSATVANHNQTMEGLSSAMSQVAPIASTLGMSLEETSTALGMMGDVGIQAERSGTALRNVLSQLSDEGSPVVKQLREMGVATRDSEGNLVSLTELLRNMEAAGIEAGQAASIFGMEAGPAMAALMNQGADALSENTETIREMEGATKQMAETQRDEFNAEAAMTRSNIEDIAISMGSTMMPALRATNAMLSDVASGFQNMSETEQKVVLGVGALLAVMGPLLLFLGTLGVAAPAVATGFGLLAGVGSTVAGVFMGGVVPALIATNVALGPITVPIWAIIAAIGALIAIAGALWYAWDNNVLGIKDITVDAFETVKGWLEAAPGWVLALLGPIGWLYMAWRENLFGVQDLVATVFDWIGQKINWLIEKIESIPGVDFSDEDVEAADAVPDPADVGEAGAAAGQAGGEAYKKAFEQSGSPDSSALAPGAAPGEVPDPGDLSIDPSSMHTKESIEMAARNGRATPESLGLTDDEFNRLLGDDSGGAGRSSRPAIPTARSGSTRRPSISPSGIANAIRDALEGLIVRVETGDETLDRIIEEEATVIVQNTLKDEARKSKNRGVRGAR